MLPALIRSEQRNIPQVVRPVNHQPPTGNSRHELCITSGGATMSPKFARRTPTGLSSTKSLIR